MAAFEPFVLAATGRDKYALLQVRACIAQILQVIVDSASDPLQPSPGGTKSTPLSCETLGRAFSEEPRLARKGSASIRPRAEIRDFGASD
jgi:hypothetical protein